MEKIQVKRGLVLFCPICGAEITVVGAGKGKLSSRCCNSDMIVKGSVTTMFICPHCGAEVMMLTPGVGNTTPRCCNNYMARFDIN